MMEFQKWLVSGGIRTIPQAGDLVCFKASPDEDLAGELTWKRGDTVCSFRDRHGKNGTENPSWEMRISEGDAIGLIAFVASCAGLGIRKCESKAMGEHIFELIQEPHWSEEKV